MAHGAEGAQKRPAINPPSAASSDFDPLQTFVTGQVLGEEIKSAAEDIGSRLMGHVDSSIRALAAGVTSEVATVQHNVDTRLGNLSERISDVEHRAEVLQAATHGNTVAIAQLNVRQAELERQLLIANQTSVTRQEVDSNISDRPANPEIIRINARRYVTKLSVREAIEPWLHEVGIKSDQYSLVGHAPNGKQFTIKFPLNPLSSARLAREALDGLRDEDGIWKKFQAKLVNGSLEQINIGGDENNKTRTIRRMSKAFKTAMGELHAEVEDVHYRAYKEAIFFNNVGIANLTQPPIPQMSLPSCGIMTRLSLWVWASRPSLLEPCSCFHDLMMISNGLFNIFHPASPTGFVKKAFNIGSWNARSLFHFDRTKLKRKITVLQKHLKGMDVFCVQESKGSWADILKHCRLISRDFGIRASFAEGYGGCITFVSKAPVPDDAAIFDTALIPGRALSSHTR